MKKYFIITLLLGIISTSLFAESNIQKFWNLMNEDKYEEVEGLLSDWEKATPKDAELYVAYFNYYISQSYSEQMKIETIPPTSGKYSGKYFEGKNEAGENIYLYPSVTYDEALSEKAFEYIDKGISYNPKRLDMYFGKAHFCFIKKDYLKQKDEIEKVFDLNKKNKDKWLWSDNVSIDKVPISFEDSIHEYIVSLLQTKDQTAIECSKEIALLFVKNYPKNPIAYNDAAVSHIYLDDFKSAKKYYKLGYECDKSDLILLTNLAHVCINLGETKEAKEYYTILSKSSDTKYSDFAKQQLESMK